MVSLRICVPDGTINYIKNPAFRYDTTDWNVQGATLTRTLTRARFGVASGKVVTNGAALHEGVYFRVSVLTNIREPITVSAYVRGAGKVRIRLDDNSPGGNEYISETVQLIDSRWTRIEMTGRSHGGNDLRLYVETDEGVAAVRTFYVDGAQLERHPYITTYCDGDQEKCFWKAVEHASASERPAATRAGGRWVELSGKQREADDLYMTVAGGLGVPPIQNNIQNFAQEAGGYHQGVKVQMRPITLTFHAKNQALFRDRPVSLEKLHALRQLLLDVVKPDRTGGDEDILFEYTDGSIPLYFRARYDGGLEGEWDVRNGWVNSFPLRLLAVSPMVMDDTQEAQVLDYQDSTVANNVAAYIDGNWTNMNYGLNYWIAPRGFARSPRGEIYMIAWDNNLTTANDNALAVEPLTPVRTLLKWNGEYFEKVSPIINMGGTGNLYAIAIHPNGDIYVTGDFTSIGGVAANRIARWDGSTWNALGSGLNGRGTTLDITPEGNVYVGGLFTTAGGSGSSHLAYWDGGSWHLAGNVSTDVTALAVSPDGAFVYYATNGTISVYDIVNASNTIVVTNSAITNAPHMKFSPSGVLHILGGRVYYLVGSSLQDYGTLLIQSQNPSLIISLAPYDLDFFEDGTFLVAGQATVPIKGGNYTGVFYFNGSSFVDIDVDIDLALTSPTILGTRSVLISKHNIFIGWWGGSATTRRMLYSASNTVTNPGTAECRPRFHVVGPAQLRWIENQTTGKRIYLNINIFSGEQVMIDINKGMISSNLRPNILYGLLPGSDFRGFTLLPGENNIKCLMANDINAQMSIQFEPLHWGMDAAAGES